jgi:hypothetical protein
LPLTVLVFGKACRIVSSRPWTYGSLVFGVVFGKGGGA